MTCLWARSAGRYFGGNHHGEHLQRTLKRVLDLCRRPLCDPLWFSLGWAVLL